MAYYQDDILHKIMDLGLPVNGINSDGILSFSEDASDRDKESAQTIMDKYWPAVTHGQKPIGVPVVDPEVAGAA